MYRQHLTFEISELCRVAFLLSLPCWQQLTFLSPEYLSSSDSPTRSTFLWRFENYVVLLSSLQGLPAVPTSSRLSSSFILLPPPRPLSSLSFPHPSSACVRRRCLLTSALTHPLHNDDCCADHAGGGNPKTQFWRLSTSTQVQLSSA